MALSKNEVINLVKKFLNLCVQKHHIKQAYLFGSYATGRAKDYSDVDLAIVLETLSTSEDTPYSEGFRIFHEAQQYNSILEVVCFPEESFHQNSNPLVARIKQEGIPIM
jgi:predicted nucleotidyltransferase